MKLSRREVRRLAKKYAHNYGLPLSIALVIVEVTPLLAEFRLAKIEKTMTYIILKIREERALRLAIAERKRRPTFLKHRLKNTCSLAA